MNLIINTFADAPAKDAYLPSRVLTRALALKTQIFSFHVLGRHVSKKDSRRRDR